MKIKISLSKGYDTDYKIGDRVVLLYSTTFGEVGTIIDFSKINPGSPDVGIKTDSGMIFGLPATDVLRMWKVKAPNKNTQRSVPADQLMKLYPPLDKMPRDISKKSTKPHPDDVASLATYFRMWVEGDTGLEIRKSFAEALENVFPDRKYPWPTFKGYAYRLWFNQGVSQHKWKSYLPTLRTDAVFTSHSKSLAAVISIIKKYKVDRSAVVTRVKVEASDCFCDLPELYKWIRGSGIDNAIGLLPRPSVVKSEEEILLTSTAVKSKTKMYGIVNGDTVETLDGTVNIKSGSVTGNKAGKGSLDQVVNVHWGPTK